MKKLLISLFATLVCVTVQAEIGVIFYKENLRVTTTGGGQTSIAAKTGWLLFDGTDFAFVTAHARSKTFYVETVTTWEINEVLGLRTTNTVVTFDDGQTAGLVAKGIDRTVKLGTETNSLPLTMTLLGSDVYENTSNTNTFFDQYAGTLALDRVNTISATNLDLSGAIERCRQFYLTKGYTNIVFETGVE